MSNVHCGQNSVNSGSAITAISIKTLKPTQQPKCIPQHHDNIPSASTLQNQYFKIIWIPFNFFSCQNLNLQFISLNSIFSTSRYFKILLPTIQRKWHQHIINVSIDAQDFFHWLCKILDKTKQKLACLLHLISDEIPSPRTKQLTCSTRTVKLATLGRCLVTSKMFPSPAPPHPQPTSPGVLSCQRSCPQQKKPIWIYHIQTEFSHQTERQL